jgi:D-alanyl-D-alanine carboxypeptidase (penicillin-binding protein 5/6)
MSKILNCSGVRPIVALFLSFIVSLPANAAVPIPAAPDLPVRAHILVDFDSGRVLTSLNADQKLEPASLTKLMTAYAVFVALRDGRMQLGEEIAISEKAWRAEGSRSFVEVGKRIPAEALIKGMIVQSGNDASIALAERVGGSEDGFAAMMNEYARRLGMANSHFTNATGLPDPALYVTARDMATLARALIREFPQYYKWYSLRDFVYNGISQPNRNGLLARDPTVDGLKTGHTETAGYCLVSSALRNRMRLVSVVLGTPSIKAREDASATLLNYGYTFFETVKVHAAGDTILKPRVYKGAVAETAAVLRQNLFVTVGRSEGVKVQAAASLREPLIAPLPANVAIGEITVRDGADVVAKVPLFPVKTVAAGGWWTRASDTVSLWFR